MPVVQILHASHRILCSLSTFCPRHQPTFSLPLPSTRAFHPGARKMGKPRLIIICRHAQSEVDLVHLSSSFSQMLITTQGQQKPRNPSVHTRSPSPAHGRRMGTSPRSRPQAALPAPPDRHGPSVRQPISQNTTDRRRNAFRIDFGRSIALALPPAHHQSLRRASSTRAGFRKLPARRCRDEPDVAGESRLRTL